MNDKQSLYDRLVELATAARADADKPINDVVDAFLRVPDFENRIHVKRLINDPEGSAAYLYEEGLFHVRNWAKCRKEMAKRGIPLDSVFGAEQGPSVVQQDDAEFEEIVNAREVAATVKMAPYCMARNRFERIAWDIMDPRDDQPDIIEPAAETTVA